jgi:hypothetical protein
MRIYCKGDVLFTYDRRCYTKTSESIIREHRLIGIALSEAEGLVPVDDATLRVIQQATLIGAFGKSIAHARRIDKIPNADRR